MSTIDIDALLIEIDSAAPCGPNLEYDPAFLELDLAILGKPEVQYGSTITPAVAPEWKVIKRVALALFGRSKDLRLAVPLLRSLLALDGVSGFSDGLLLIERMLEERWATLHPQLEPDDDLDPMLRINSLAMLADPMTVLRELKDATLINLPGLGPLSVRVLEIASGEIPPPAGQEKIAGASLDAALRDLPVQEVKATFDAISQAFNSATNIEVILVRHVGSAQALNLSGLTKGLKRGADFFKEHLASRPDAQPNAADTNVTNNTNDTLQEEQAALTTNAVRGTVPVAPISDDIKCPTDVIRVLDKILKYYAEYERSSPVPLLVGRTKRLVLMNFMELMQELGPEGIPQLLIISGNQTE